MIDISMRPGFFTRTIQITENQMLLIRQADLQRLKMIVMGEKNMQNQYVGGEEVLFTSTVGDNNAFKNI